MTRDKNPHITISDQDPGLPYSKGLMASQVMVTGLSAYRAYEVAETIEVRLLDEGRSSISSLELSQVALEIIGELAGERLIVVGSRRTHHGWRISAPPSTGHTAPVT